MITDILAGCTVIINWWVLIRVINQRVPITVVMNIQASLFALLFQLLLPNRIRARVQCSTALSAEGGLAVICLVVFA